VPVDCIRPAIRDDAEVQQWYRCNTLLYVDETRLDALSDHARAMIVSDGTPLSNYWPLTARLRQSLLRLLPLAGIDALARLNAMRFARGSDRD
jgi:hypothetical protein